MVDINPKTLENLKEKIVGVDDVVNTVKEREEEAGTMEDLKKDFPDKNEKVKGALENISQKYENIIS